MGLLDSMYGESAADPRSQAMAALTMGLLQKNVGGGLLAANQVFAAQPALRQQAEMERMRMGLLQSQIDENNAQAQARQQASERARRQQEALPGLYGQDGKFNVQGALLAGFDPDTIGKYAGLSDLGRPQVARTIETTDAQGRPVTVQFDKYGNRIGGEMGKWQAPVFQNLGNRTVALDPTSLQERGSFAQGMSPEGRDASARGWAGLNETKRHNAVAEGSANAGRAPQGYRFRTDGSLEAIPGGPADKQAAATTDERKAATLLQRLEGSQAQLAAAVKESPGAAKPELIASGLRAMPGIGSEPLANTFTSANRQRVEAAQLDMLDAALTLGTGAAYTREQLEGYRKAYFPQIGDDQKTVADKQDRLRNVIQAARIAAGRAGNAIQPASTAQPGQPSIDDLLKKYGK